MFPSIKRTSDSQIFCLRSFFSGKKGREKEKKNNPGSDTSLSCHRPNAWLIYGVNCSIDRPVPLDRRLIELNMPGPCTYVMNEKGPFAREDSCGGLAT